MGENQTRDVQMVELRKNNKRNRILHTIRYNMEVSRFDVKKITKYSMTTVLNNIGELLASGLICQEAAAGTRVGRKPDWLSINPNGAYFIGVEFNAKALHCVVIDFRQQVVYAERRPFHAQIETEELLDIMKSAIAKAIVFLGAGKKEKIRGIGVGIPGFSDKENGVGLYYAHLHGFQNVPVRRVIEDEFHIKTLIENNVNAMAVAYKAFKMGEGVDDFVLISIRMGTRMGIVIGNKIYNGYNGNAGEISHMKIANSNRLCACGKKGCLDTEVSEIAILNKIIEGVRNGRFQQLRKKLGPGFEQITIEDFIECVKAGDEDSVRLLADTAQCLGLAVSYAASVLNPKTVVVSGDIVFDDSFVQEFRAAICENLNDALAGRLKIRRMKFDDNIAAVGAAMLVLLDEFEPLEPEI